MTLLCGAIHLIFFSNNTVIYPARPITVQMSYVNYRLNHRISLSIRHGDSLSFNSAVVSASDQVWLNAMFVELQDAIKSLLPQDPWVRKHKTILLALISLGIGTAGIWILNSFVFAFIDWVIINEGFSPPSQTPNLQRIVERHEYLFYFIRWFGRLIAGYLWGAWMVRKWLLALWPSIEFNFGPPHLRIEREKRKRLGVVLTIIVIPLLTNLIYDVFKLIAKFN